MIFPLSFIEILNNNFFKIGIKRNRKEIYSLLFYFLFFSCTQEVSYQEQSLNPNNYVTWVQQEDHELKKIKEIEELKFTLQYCTPEYLACLELKENASNDSLLKEKVKEKENSVNFILEISIPETKGEILKYNLPNIAEYEGRVDYFAFKVNQDIVIFTEKDTIPCAMHLFERMFDISPKIRILLAFDAEKIIKSPSFTLQYNDQVFQKGPINFTFDTKTLKNIPQLKTISP